MAIRYGRPQKYPIKGDKLIDKRGRQYDPIKYHARIKRNNDRFKARRNEIKKQLIQAIGGLKCSVCGYEGGRTCEYVFHHLHKKDFDIDKLLNHPSAIENAKAEVSKCKVLCARCHPLVHMYGYDYARVLEYLKKLEPILREI